MSPILFRTFEGQNTREFAEILLRLKENGGKVKAMGEREKIYRKFVRIDQCIFSILDELESIWKHLARF